MSEIAKMFITLGSKFDGTGFEMFGRKLEGLEKSLKGIGLLAAATGIAELIREASAAYGEQERITFRLGNALRAAGLSSAYLQGKITTLANEIRDTTMFTDEETTSASTLALQLGVVQENIEPLIKASADLASALGMSLQSAMTLIVRTSNGSAQGMSKLGIKLDEAQLKGKGLAYVLDEVNKRMGGSAQAEVKGYAGSVDQATKAWDELVKAIGEKTAPAMKEANNWWTNALKFLADRIKYGSASAKRLMVQLEADMARIAEIGAVPTPPAAGEEAPPSLDELLTNVEALTAYNASLRNDSASTASSVQADWQSTFQSIGSYMNTFTSIFSQGMTELINGSEDAFSNMAKAFQNAVMQMVATLASQAALLALLSAFFPGLGQGLSFAGKGASMFGGIWNLFPAFAGGVRGFGGGLALVGERGPELVNLPAGTNVYNNQDSRNMLDSSIVVNVNGGGLGDRRAARQLARTIGDELHNQLKRSRRV